MGPPLEKIFPASTFVFFSSCFGKTSGHELLNSLNSLNIFPFWVIPPFFREDQAPSPFFLLQSPPPVFSSVHLCYTRSSQNHDVTMRSRISVSRAHVWHRRHHLAESDASSQTHAGEEGVGQKDKTLSFPTHSSTPQNT